MFISQMNNTKKHITFKLTKLNVFFLDKFYQKQFQINFKYTWFNVLYK